MAAGEINFGLLDPNAPGKIATSFIQGQQLGQQYRAQELQNQAAEAQYQNMLAKQEAYKAAGGDYNKLAQELTNRGLPEEALKIRKDVREEKKLGMEMDLKSAELHREDLTSLYHNPTDASFQAYLTKNQGRFTPEQVQQAVGQWVGKTPEQRQQMLLPQLMTMDKYLTHLNQQEQTQISRANLGVNQGQLALAQKREQRLAAGPVGTSLSPEQNQALFGENGAVANGKIDPTKINSRNAKMWADAFILNPNADPAKVSQDVKAAEKVVKDFMAGDSGKKVTAFNTAINHLDTIEQLGKALDNNDVRAFNALGNKLAAETGKPAPTNFNQAAKIVGAEVAKSIIPGPGTGKEREEFAKPFDSANSPAQLAGAIKTAKELMGGQLQSLDLKYRTGTKRSDFADQLSPAARQAYDAARTKSKPAAAAAPAQQRPSGVGSDWKFMSDAAGNKAWVSPDGKSFKEVK